MKLLNISQVAKISEGCPFAVEISQRSNLNFMIRETQKVMGKRFECSVMVNKTFL